MHLASRLVQNDHAPRRGRPFHPFDKRYRAGSVPRVGVHFLNDRPRSVEELDTELYYRTLAVTTPTVARTFATPHISSRYRAPLRRWEHRDRRKSRRRRLLEASIRDRARVRDRSRVAKG